VIDPTSDKLILAGSFSNLSRKNRVDNVTGLLNKYEFEKAAKDLIQKGVNFQIMLVNIDDFSRINAIFDRNFGDDVLRINAQYIQNVLSSAIGVYRLDSDSFGIIFDNSTREEITVIYEMLRSHFSIQQTLKNRKYFFTISAGCATFDENCENFCQIYKNAHTALEYAKKHGKNKLIFFSAQFSNMKLRELELAEYLRESIENNFKNFEVFTQPQVDAKTGKLKGGEALLRWHCEKYGAVIPSEFIPILEETNLISPVGRWVFETAIKQLKIWVSYLPDFQISINVSYLQLFDANFVDFIKQTVEENEVNFDNIVIELTESRFVTDKELLKNTFIELRQLGINIAMDDFGVGYSSLEILKEIPADIVKIDKAFVKNIRNSSFDMAFVKFVVDLCHNIGIKVCLEGVEELEEMVAVSDINLDFIQGYLFGKPINDTDFETSHF
jgi:diguanylate cyclase (GGDEF)-like protein